MLSPADNGFAARAANRFPQIDLVEAPEAYLTEERGALHASSALLARPRSTEEVSQLVSFCASVGVAIIPYSGGTGLVGGHVLPEGPKPLLLSLERMTAIRDVDAEGNTLVVEAGVILADVHTAAKRVDRLFPLSLASEGSCRIGGNLATNAGGVQVLRYGNARDLCLGIEAVLPDGSIHHGLRKLRKDNTGYDLRNLLIGAEGTLGVITAATLKLFPRPKEQAVALAVVPSPAAAITLLTDMQENLDGLVSAFELIDGEGLRFLQETIPQIRLPFDDIPDWLVLTEVGGGPGSGVQDRLFEVLGNALEAGGISDVLLAQNLQQQQEFWTVRENIPIANKLIGAINSHDISVPIHRIPEFIEEGRQLLSEIGTFRLNCFGHLGDGNLHYNVYPPKGRSKAEFKDVKSVIQTVVHDLVHAYGGSISAEHGIGRVKADDLQKYGDPAKLAAMRAIKDALDPKGFMNPGAIFQSG